MNTIFLAAVSLLLLYLGYRYYSSVLARQLGIDESEETPAVKQHDGVDFVPAKHWLILFGHLFCLHCRGGSHHWPSYRLPLLGLASRPCMDCFRQHLHGCCA